MFKRHMVDEQMFADASCIRIEKKRFSDPDLLDE